MIFSYIFDARKANYIATRTARPAECHEKVVSDLLILLKQQYVSSFFPSPPPALPRLLRGSTDMSLCMYTIDGSVKWAFLCSVAMVKIDIFQANSNMVFANDLDGT